MLIREDDYLWMKTQIEDISFEEDSYSFLPEKPLRIYAAECPGYEGEITILETEESTEAIYHGVLPFVPEYPIACDSLVLCADNGIQGLHLIAEEGTYKIVLSPYMDTTEGMTAISEVYNDDSTFNTGGMNGFMFNGKSADTLYLSSNHWIGFGTASEQLKVLRRDGCSTALYRQKGYCGYQMEFLKIRFEGYTKYNDRVESNRLIFELFLLSNNDMFLNVIQTPTSSNTGDSSLVCGGKTTALTLFDGSGGGAKVSFFHQDAEGKTWKILYDVYAQEEVYSRAYLIGQGEKIYTIVEGSLEEITEELSAVTFMRYGLEDEPPSEILSGIPSPEILYWKSGGHEEQIRADVTAYPYPQTLVSVINMNHISILGIKMMTAEFSGTVNVKVSVDNGANFTEEIPLEEWLNTDVQELYESTGEEKILIVHFVLHGDARISRFKMTYIN